MRTVTLDIAGHAFTVSRLHGHTRLSTLFRFEITAFILEEPPPIADLLGQPFTLSLEDPFGRILAVHGTTMTVKRAVSPGGSAAYALSLGPSVAPLGVGKSSRVFQEMTAVDIVKDVLDKAGVPSSDVRWATSGSYPTRPYCAQYRESDLAFIERLLAEEGIYFWFEHTGDATVLALGDDSTAAPEIDEGAAIAFRDDDQMVATEASILRVRRTSRITSSKAALRDYNFDKPRLTLDSKDGDGAMEVYDWPGRFGVPSDGDRLATVALESIRAGAAVLHGETSTTRILPGLVFELTDHPIAAMNGRYLVESVTIEATELRGGEASELGNVQLRFTAVPASTMFRAPREHVTRTPGGPQTGVVVGASGEEIHPDKSGRIRVQLYWDREGARDDKASTWMRVGQFALGGSMVIPRVGWDVLVHHHEGDIDAPVVATHLYDGQFPVPYSLPANKTRTAWQTATTPGGGSSNEIRFEDKAGSEELFINASKDMNIVIGDKKKESVAVNSTHTIGANHDVKIGSNAKYTVGVNQDVTIGASETLSVSGDRSVFIKGSETSTVGGSRTVTVTSGASLQSKASRTLTVGGTMLGAAAAAVTRSVLGSMSVTVGGSWIQAAAVGLADMTLGAGAETIGGAKILAAGGGASTNVKGALAETVGGAYVIAAGGNVTEGATGSQAITVGGAFVANAPNVLLEAQSEISVRVGGASLTIKSSSVEIKAPAIAAPGATIAKTASKIQHN